VAQKLHDDYGFSYDTLKVLLGGWTGWQAANATDPTGYPIDTGSNPLAALSRGPAAANCK
jgi:hypothetical protein